MYCSVNTVDTHSNTHTVNYTHTQREKREKTLCIIYNIQYSLLQLLLLYNLCTIDTSLLVDKIIKSINLLMTQLLIHNTNTINFNIFIGRSPY